MTSTRPAKFVVLTTQRSGSTWVIDVLNKLDGAKAYGELLLEQERVWDAGSLDYPRFTEAPVYGTKWRPAALFAYLDALYQQPGAVGFKLMYSQVMAYPEVLPYLRMRGAQVVHLVRRNYLDILISKALKKASGRPHNWQGQDVLRTQNGTAQLQPKGRKAQTVTQVALDASTLVRDMKRLERKYKLFRAWLLISRQPHIEVAYESLAREPASFEAIRAFLGLQEAGALPQTDLRKVKKGGHQDVLTNYDEVHAAVRNSAFARLIQ